MLSDSQLRTIRERISNLKNNKVLDGEGADKSENLHRLFMYPAMMVPATQYAVIQAVADSFDAEPWAIDPFMGSGTSLLSCMELGFNVFGQDINPFAVLLTEAKVERYNISLLKTTCTEVIRMIVSDECDRIEVSFPNIDKWFNPEVQVSLSKIRRAIQSVDDRSIRSFLWVTMAEIIRIGSNDRTSTFKLHRRSEEEIENRNVDVVKEFSSLVRRGIKDIEDYWKKLSADESLRENRDSMVADIRWGDSKERLLTDLRFDLLVSSPPYGDNHTTVTYGQTSYLPLQWIDPQDIVCPFDYVRTTQEIDRQSLGGTLNKKEIMKTIAPVFIKAPSLDSFFKSIPSEEQVKYFKTLSFIADFDKCLDTIVEVMKADAFYIWTIGNRYVGNREVPNDQFLVDLMESRGISLFERAERQILNKKQARKNNYSNTMEKEHILIFHRNV